jgi:two-component system response regulator YesN
VDFPIKLNKTYKQAQIALKQRNLLQKDMHIHQYTKDQQISFSKLHFNKYEEAVRFAIRKGDVNDIDQIAKLWIQDLKKLKVITQEYVEFFWNEYYILTSYWIDEFLKENAHQVHHKKQQWVMKNLMKDDALSLEKWEKVLGQELKSLIKTIQKYKQKENQNIIEQIAAYIRKNYEKELTLKEISEQFFLSKEHISRKFKQEMGENLSEYICRIRMDKARDLLKDPEMKIKRVAELVGYKDEKYFYKVFKNVNGISPNEYKKKFEKG